MSEIASTDLQVVVISSNCDYLFDYKRKRSGTKFKLVDFLPTQIIKLINYTICNILHDIMLKCNM